MIEDVARHLRLAPHVAAAANAIVSELRASGPFNGIHLRMEADAQYQDLVGGMEACRSADRAAFMTVSDPPSQAFAKRYMRTRLPATLMSSRAVHWLVD